MRHMQEGTHQCVPSAFLHYVFVIQKLYLKAVNNRYEKKCVRLKNIYTKLLRSYFNPAPRLCRRSDYFFLFVHKPLKNKNYVKKKGDRSLRFS